MRPCTPEDKTMYYKSYERIIQKFVILQTIKRNNIIYGSQAIRGQMPESMITRKPRDWDVHSKNPRRDANEMARLLNQFYGCEMFYVLHKARDDATRGYGKIHVYSVKNKSIKYSKVEQRHGMSVHIQKAHEFTEIDYTYMMHPDNFVYNNTDYGKVKVRPLETIKKHRKRISKKPDYRFRREKDESMIRDIERSQAFKKVQTRTKRKQVPVTDWRGKTKIISLRKPKSVMFTPPKLKYKRRTKL